MLQLATKSILTRRVIIGSAGVALMASQMFFTGGWFNQKTIYPPTDITTQNRLFPTYINSQNELHDLLLFKEPLVLNFTYMADPKSNKLTQALYNILGYKERYPLNSNTNPVNLASISCDTPGGRDLMLTYGVNKVPSLVALHKQIPTARYVSKSDEIDEKDLSSWIAGVGK
ncbi:hypothetical protein CAAN1_04S06920 [[Candida] anglica]|uniref:Thioredoxin domain-containing protein n=1 Tax=[Candida] anglica TaxID=148631 RepID=A0ABP0E8F6_9ASCO